MFSWGASSENYELQNSLQNYSLGQFFEFSLFMMINYYFSGVF